jgi:hypothetical protein
MNVTPKQMLRLYSVRPELVDFLSRYVSPETEQSIAKGIPLDFLSHARRLNEVLPIRLKYRGKRRSGWRGKSTCLKQDATSFAIYPR